MLLHARNHQKNSISSLSEMNCTASLKKNKKRVGNSSSFVRQTRDDIVLVFRIWASAGDSEVEQNRVEVLLEFHLILTILLDENNCKRTLTGIKEFSPLYRNFYTIFFFGDISSLSDYHLRVYFKKLIYEIESCPGTRQKNKKIKIKKIIIKRNKKIKIKIKKKMNCNESNVQDGMSRRKMTIYKERIENNPPKFLPQDFDK